MRRVTLGVRLLAVALLAACASAPQGGYRASGTAIYSNAVFQPERLSGRWVQVADFAGLGAAGCAASGLVVVPEGGQLGLEADLCIGGVRRAFRGEATVTGPGRITLAGADPAGLGAEWWVLWVDDGYRTLVIGTPSGQFGFVLNRDPVLPADRQAAAREVLVWNGYDLSRMRAVAAP